MPVLKSKKANKSKQKEGRPVVFQSLKGMHDILPKDGVFWKAVLKAGFDISEFYDFHFIETPIIEEAALFEAGVGAITDIVEKEMFSFKTRGGERVVLRPEGTAPIVRSYIQHHLGYYASPLKVFYFGPMFRYENPQQGRYRQFHQWGFEIIGDADAFYDAQIIFITLDFLKTLGLKDVTVKINTLGCRVCRPTYRKKLLNFYRSKKESLCVDCNNRYEKNPLRLLDCKKEECGELKKNIPVILDYLCHNCNNHFKNVLEFVEEGMIDYEPDPCLVRGLDYYSRTVFEVFAKDNLNAFGGGGRYDYLAEILGSRLVPAVGVSLGLERIIENMANQNFIPKSAKQRSFVFFVAMGEQAKKTGVRIIKQLREARIPVSESVGKQSLKAQLKSADRMRAPLALILGQKECFEGSIIIRDMKSSVQETMLVDKIVEEVKKRLK